jgi:adenine/guanine/hypoxanthine permease
MTLRVRGMNRLDRFFEISARKSSVAAELRGGVVTFIAMAYIIVLNPIIHPFCRVRLI